MGKIENSTLEISSTAREETPGIVQVYNFEIAGKTNRVVGLEFYRMRLLFRLKILFMLFRILKNPVKVYRIKRSFTELRTAQLGSHRITKLVKSNGKYYYDLHDPGFPSVASLHFGLGEINRIYPFRGGRLDLKTVIIGITRKCPLRCEHCFERDALDGKERLTLSDLKIIVQKLQEKGVAQIQLSGGEPMMRLDDVLELIRTARRETEFLLLTSGYNMIPENAMKLKYAGLAGITVALDHFDPVCNNRIKGNPNAFRWAMKAIENAHSAGLMVSLSLCAGRNFATKENLETYMNLAKKLGVAFVHILEPRAVGNQSKSNTELTAAQEQMLEELYLKMNFQREYRSMPIISYHGYHQRRTGCFGAGDRYLYIDTEGDVHACPFCRHKTGNLLHDDLLSIFEKLKITGCHKFETFAHQHIKPNVLKTLTN